MIEIRKAAKFNGIVLLEEQESNYTTKESEKTEKEPESLGPMVILQNKRMRRWSFNLYFTWAANSLVFNGLCFSASNISKDESVYTIFVALALIGIPFIMAMSYVMEKWGRRLPLVVSMVSSGVCCLIAAFLPDDSTWLVMILAVLGRGFISASYSLIFFYTSEIYPTSLRSTGVGICSAMARIGGFSTPFVVAARFMGESTSLIVYGVVTVIAGVCALDLPETFGKPLPKTLADVYDLE